MLKITGLLLIFSVCVIAGFQKADELKTKKYTLQECLFFLRQFSIQLQSRQLPPGQIIRLLSSQTAFKTNCLVQVLQQHFQTSSSFERNLRLAITQCPQLMACGADQVLLTLGDIIGSRALDEQLGAIDSAEKLLEESLSEAETTLQNRGMLYRRLGILSGLMIVVMFW